MPKTDDAHGKWRKSRNTSNLPSPLCQHIQFPASLEQILRKLLLCRTWDGERIEEKKREKRRWEEKRSKEKIREEKKKKWGEEKKKKRRERRKKWIIDSLSCHWTKDHNETLKHQLLRIKNCSCIDQHTKQWSYTTVDSMLVRIILND